MTSFFTAKAVKNAFRGSLMYNVAIYQKLHPQIKITHPYDIYYLKRDGNIRTFAFDLFPSIA